MAVQVRVRGSPAVSIGLLSTVSSVVSATVGVTAEYVHYRKEALYVEAYVYIYIIYNI